MTKRSTNHFSSLLRTIVSASEISRARQTHAQALIHGFLSDVTLQTDLMRAYTKCGPLRDARKVFVEMPERGMHSWNILISSYVQSLTYSLAFGVFDELRKTGLRPDHYTLPPLFKACVGIGDAFYGKALYGLATRLGIKSYVVVESAFLDLCLKCGSVVEARRVFFEMPRRDAAAWNAMISGLARSGLFREALSFFGEMIGQSVEADAMAIPSVLTACGGEGDLTKGKEIHGRVSKVLNYDADIAVANSLIDMYAKCGSLDDAERVFETVTEASLVTWTAMISCYGLHGRGLDSLLLYEKMIAIGLRPNRVTLTAVLSSLGHSGLVDEASRIFGSIGSELSVEHYACMVDLLGRSGQLDGALRLAKRIEKVTPASVWGALLAGCATRGNVEIGEIAASKLFELEPRNSSNFVALCGIYESRAMWDRISVVRSRMRELGLVKTPGCSWITVSGIVHRFYQADRSHPLTVLIYETLDLVTGEASLAGESSSEQRLDFPSLL